MILIRIGLLIALFFIATSAPAYASDKEYFRFAEGYSSATPGAPADILHRAFTIYTAQEACTRSPAPNSIRVNMGNSEFTTGGRIHRNGQSELRIEAYDTEGKFLPAVPITVDVAATSDVIRSHSDLDYIEATGCGEVEVIVRWLCKDVNGSARFEIRKTKRSPSHNNSQERTE